MQRRDTQITYRLRAFDRRLRCNALTLLLFLVLASQIALLVVVGRRFAMGRHPSQSSPASPASVLFIAPTVGGWHSVSAAN